MEYAAKILISETIGMLAFMKLRKLLTPESIRQLRLQRNKHESTDGGLLGALNHRMGAIDKFASPEARIEFNMRQDDHNLLPACTPEAATRSSLNRHSRSATSGSTAHRAGRPIWQSSR